MTGRGKFIFASGATFDGQLLNGRFQGPGTFISMKVGSFYANVRHFYLAIWCSLPRRFHRKQNAWPGHFHVSNKECEWSILFVTCEDNMHLLLFRTNSGSFFRTAGGQIFAGRFNNDCYLNQEGQWVAPNTGAETKF